VHHFTPISRHVVMRYMLILVQFQMLNIEQLDAVITELRDRYHGKWPLVILHNKRISKLMENSSNRHLIETWRANGALYTTPSGSNDDW
jgi:proteinaceous RNase P